MRLAGIVMLLMCILAFTFQSEVAHHLQADLGYSQPYFILWVAHSSFISLLPIQFIIERLRGKPFKQTCLELVSDSQKLLQEYRGNRKVTPSIKSTVLHLAYTSIALATLLTAGSYLWYVALGLTTMARLTAIYNTSCFFAYGFSLFFLNEKFMLSKIAALAVSIAGVVVMSFGESHSEVETMASYKATMILGDIISCVCALLIGLYEVVYKRYTVIPESPSILFTNFFTGLIGLMTFSLQWIPIVFLHYTGIERFSIPTKEVLTYLCLNAFLGVAYNGCFMSVITLTSPTFAALGIILTIPAVAIADFLVNGITVTTVELIGGAFIIAGFGIFAYADTNATGYKKVEVEMQEARTENPRNVF
ncbi:hypothetical protein K493DRAFT_212350 [Basidiobolus meristosporus CBS 931.73]|uniref:EamA domain-containing protein n=1 Tax=Basidiobolus meristosporus CBS 931.73 TaxID=1314790 RepID=A0A1Y1YNQ6_9FUNG|nr:hypothetical protein K493DRAFT_212350 [Basidiobolus meristosporus CBS 931.73]|eukprot:ORX99641.1 hypothetical protein K493DRAFT_212350 [Basidiobolus meristosporus CBS 931.73]